MNIVITGRGLDVSDRVKAQVEKKFAKLNKYFSNDITAYVTLTKQKDTCSIEVTIPVKGSIIRAEERSDDLFAGIDIIDEVLERQLRRHKTKLIDRSQHSGSFLPDFLEDDENDDEAEIKIERVKNFALDMMSAEEACLQMDLLGHSFFVFKDGDTGKTAVVYKRKNNGYGLIRPE